MNAPIGRLALGAALILAAACSRSEGSAAGGASDLTPVNRAVAVARGVRAHPNAADSILAAHGLSRDEFDALMYDIAADSALARAYTEAIR